jgi:NAD(P)-dependent dehydrogenase (short-subunit alcohol dehydrogenase family)
MERDGVPDSFTGAHTLANVLITGTSSGIGLATALAFARNGHTVAATMRHPDRAPALATTAAAGQLPIQVFAMDVDQDESVRDGVARVVAAMGPIDVLVNNAGMERTGSVEELALPDFRAVMETNYFGALRAIQAVLPAMRERRTGCIVNVSSVSGRFAASPFAAYAASKFALEALSECLAQEVKSFGIRVRVIEPGIIDTGMSRSISVPKPDSHYPQQRRNARLFAAVLQQPVPASLVADAVVSCAATDSSQLRHLVGPDAAPFLGWRQAMSDEQWVEFGALDDAAWVARIKADFGIDLTLTE